jgi:acyl-coenzyme A synthetase/AMP-(fatty) acid ligase
MANSEFKLIDKYSSNIALIGKNSFRMSYKQIVEEADIFGRFLKRRCLVFLICDDSMDCIILYLSMIRRGVVIALLNNSTRPNVLRSLVKKYSPEFILSTKNPAEKYYSWDIVASYGRYKLFRTEYPYDLGLDSQLCLLLGTSGSTGSPKFVRLSYKNLESNAYAIADYLAIRDRDRAMATMSISYSYGLSIIHSHLLCGAAVIVPEASIVTRNFWDLFVKEGATTFGGVPYIFHMLDQLGFQQRELPSLEYITQAGGKLANALGEKFLIHCKSKSIRFITMYGQTEASPRMTYLPWEFAEKKRGSIGKSILGGELWLEDEFGNQINDSFNDGEIVYKGPNVMMGYAYSREDLGLHDEMRGILHTGDIGYRDDDGFYYISGRKNRMIKIFGLRINLDEIEEILKEGGYECACSGVDEEMRIYVTKDTADENITRFVEQKTGINKAGYTVLYLDNLPMLSSGKVAYLELL